MERNLNKVRNKALKHQERRDYLREDPNFKEQINDLEISIKESIKQTGYDVKKEYPLIKEDKNSKELVPFSETNLQYFNEYGGFTKER